MFKKKYSITDLESIISIKSPTRSDYPIVIIDDEDYPIKELLQNMGFMVTHINDITTIHELEAYYIVVCDIRNVGKSFDSKYGGAYIIKELYKKYPQKYRIICSGSVFNVDYNEFFKLADKSIKKGADSSDWSDILDSAINEISSPTYVWERSRAALKECNIDSKVINKIEQGYLRAIIKRDNKILDKVLTKNNSILSGDGAKFIVSALSSITANIISKIILT